MKRQMDNNTGREAERPRDIPVAGWKEVMLRVKDQLGKNNISIVAAGAAFYLFMALFPTLVAIISIYGLVTEPAEVEQHMAQIAGFLPEGAQDMLSDRLQNISQQPDSTLGWGLVLSILLSLWSANGGTKSLFQGVNIAYKEENSRSFFALNGISLLFTLGGIVVGGIAIGLVIAFPAIIDRLGLPDGVQTALQLGRWVLLAVIIMLAFSFIYIFAPVRTRPKFRWVTWGAGIATVLWIGGSLLFTWYVENLGNFDETYGSIAAVIIMMLWFNLTSFVILIGAEINAELEHQTGKDTTIGDDNLIGRRGAYHADHVASREKGK
jgi:membrane protein